MDPSARELFRTRLQRRPPVRWLHPAQLARVGGQVAMARTFGEFAARRENEASLPSEIYDLSADGSADFWLDYAADVGDGFDATYAVARSIATDTVPAQHDRPGSPAAPAHGDLLVLGGDETYPVASQANYATRTAGPYRAALPDQGAGSPALLAVPGNHDWYDGLTSFLRTFCQGWLSDVPFAERSSGTRWVDPDTRTTEYVGGWRPLQSRSYFAARLPHGWWLWGIDIQFDGYLDAPQLGYFVEAARQLGARDNLILCTAKPSWVGVGDLEVPTMEDFVARTLGERADAVRLVCSGDRHHYSRYVPDGPTGPDALVTCGGGGAYLSPTHQLPESVRYGSWAGDDPERLAEFRRVAAFPATDESRRLAARFWRIPLRNPALTAMLGSVYALLVWLLGRTQPGTSALTRLADYSLTDTRSAPASLPALLAGVLVIGCTVALARPTRVVGGRTLAGLGHGVAHLLLCIAIGYAVPGVDGDPFVVALLLTLCVGAVGGAAGALLLATYLYLGQRWTDMHANELFAGLRIEDFKSYLRIRIGPDGATVYPLGLRTVPHAWRDGGDTGPLLDPDVTVVPEAIDEPFTVPPRG